VRKHTINIFILIFFFLQNYAQNTVGLLKHNSGDFKNSYILFTPYESNRTYLINKEGKIVHFWTSQICMTRTPFILSDGTLLKTGHEEKLKDCPGGGIIEKLDWDGNVLWTYTISDAIYCEHHDIMPLPNGNILIIVSVNKSIKEAIEAGRNPSLLGSKLQSEKIMEIKPKGKNSVEIIWEWELWNHLVQDFDSSKPNYGNVSAHPELINLNYTTHFNSDEWIHLNSIDYNYELDQIMLSSLYFNEIWIIDHSTNMKQSGSHSGGRYGKGGDLLYRWGNPVTYDNGDVSQQKLFGQHNAHWIENGNPYAGDIMYFNNGINRSGLTKYSNVEIIKPPVNKDGYYTLPIPYLPAKPVWTYGDSVSALIFSPNYSSAQMLSNGNVLICIGVKGKFIEIDTLKNIVWEYINPDGNTGPVVQGTIQRRPSVFRCCLYHENYEGFKNKKLIPGRTIEIYPQN
jgi:hypothetical protein